MFEIISEGNVYETTQKNIIASLPRTAVLPDGKIACSFSVRSGPISIDTVPMISYSNDGESWSDANSLWPNLAKKESLHMSIRGGLNGQISMAGMHAYMASPDEINWSSEVQGMKENRLAYSLSKDGIHFSPLALVPLPYYASAEQPAGMLVDADGTLWMVYAPYPTIEQRETTITNQLVLLKSSDQGKTFTTSIFGNMQSDALYAETWLVRLRNNTMMVSTWQTCDTKNPDQYFLSFDDGETFTDPLPMPFKGQTTSLEPYGENGVLIPYNQRQKPLPGVWLALAYPDKTDLNMTENQSVWQAKSLTRSQTSGNFTDWTDFAFGEPHVTVLPDKTLLLTFWYEQAAVKGIRYLHLRHTV